MKRTKKTETWNPKGKQMKKFVPILGWREATPSFVKEALYGEWKRKFIFFPVLTEQHAYIGCQTVWARDMQYPEWFNCGRGRNHTQYSTCKRGFWEI
jgi:hypothetical protein